MPISSVGRKTSTRCGVTLIEMLVVVAIIALISAVALPSITTGIDSVRLRTAADSIAAFLNSAVNRTERLQQPTEIEISPGENKLRIYSSEPGLTRELEMPTGISIAGVLPRLDSNPFAPDVRRIVLLPGGSIPGMGVEIVNQHGSHRIIHLDPMTGFPRVEVPEDR